jgi:hypothetical protein
MGLGKRTAVNNLVPLENGRQNKKLTFPSAGISIIGFNPANNHPECNQRWRAGAQSEKAAQHAGFASPELAKALNWSSLERLDTSYFAFRVPLKSVLSLDPLPGGQRQHLDPPQHGPEQRSR